MADNENEMVEETLPKSIIEMVVEEDVVGISEALDFEVRARINEALGLNDDPEESEEESEDDDAEDGDESAE